MELPPRISTTPPELRSQDFEFLRAEGMSVIQTLAGLSWTDHNLHDPGITLLEAVCYAMTEAGLRAGMDVKDLITSSSAAHGPDLFTATQVLPVAPVTSVDMRKVLIDHPLVTNAWLFPVPTAPHGRFSALLEFADDELNNNVVVEEVSPATLGASYRITLAFPHWDDEDVQPFQEPITLQSVALTAWNSIEGSTSFYTRATVGYIPPSGGPSSQELWIVAQIITEMDQPSVEAPAVLTEVTALINDLGNNGPLHQLNLRVMRAFETMRRIRRYVRPYRSLCEDVVEFNAVRIQEIAVSAIIEVGSAVAIEELLAEIYFRIDRMISPPVRFKTLDERMQEGGTADLVFDGPLTDSGLLSGKELGEQQIPDTIYTSDILRIIYQLRTEAETDVIRREDVTERRIVGVRNLSLSNYIDNRPITTRARDCLRLVESHRHVPRLSVPASRIVTFRNGIEVAYDVDRVLELYNGKRQADAQQTSPQSLEIPIPKGTAYPVGEHYPIQNDLPVVYGVGEAGLPERATPARRGQARQLKGYLFPIEQLLGGFFAQLAQFNTFFSADSEIEQTLFQQPLYHIPHVAPLLKAFDPASMDWEDFQADENNAYVQLLRRAVESREQFLERRNVVLDHLLASLGEDMRDRAALLFRLAADVPGGTTMSLPDLLEAKKQRRLNALRDLIHDKAAYYDDVPQLNRDRGLAFVHPLRRSRLEILHVQKTNGAYEWYLTDVSGAPLVRQFEAAASIQEAQRTAEEALRLATSTDRYTVRVDAGERRLEIRTSPAEDPLAESVATYLTDPEAQDGIQATADAAREMWSSYALIPLEQRLYHMLGIDVLDRRRLLHTVTDYVEVFDNPDPNPNNEKRFRIWELEGFSGDLLLEGTENYPGSDDAEATELALENAQVTIERGFDLDHYVIESSGANTFRGVLLGEDGNPIATTGDFAPEEQAGAEIERVQRHLYRLFSTEGFYLVEHLLLASPDDEDVDLSIPGQDDSLSYQITIVLPSGYGRDFSLGDDEPVLEPMPPAGYRSQEFRKYAEGEVRKYCPAQVLARVLWVDRTLPGTPATSTDASFDAFEDAYLEWLDAYHQDEVDEATLGPLRERLTEVLNLLYETYYET